MLLPLATSKLCQLMTARSLPWVMVWDVGEGAPMVAVPATTEPPLGKARSCAWAGSACIAAMIETRALVDRAIFRILFACVMVMAPALRI